MRFARAISLRIATNGTGVLPEGSISRDLVHASPVRPPTSRSTCCTSASARSTTRRPNDITFGSYLRALITADLDIAPEDENGYRVALIEAFRARGIFPDRVNTLSIESLLWQAPRSPSKSRSARLHRARQLKNDIRELVETDRPATALRALGAGAGEAARYADRQGSRFSGPAEWERFLNKLGMTSRPVSQLFGKALRASASCPIGADPDTYIPRIEVHTIRPAFRAGREGRQIEQVLITLTQRVDPDLGDDGDARMIFRGGCSLILSLGDLNRVEYVIVKNIKSYGRFRSRPPT